MNINTLDQFSASVLGGHQDNCADECCVAPTSTTHCVADCPNACCLTDIDLDTAGFARSRRRVALLLDISGLTSSEPYAAAAKKRMYNLICARGHKFNTHLGADRDIVLCKECVKLDQAQLSDLSAHAFGYTPSTAFISVDKPRTYKCQYDHTFRACPNILATFIGCPTCIRLSGATLEQQLRSLTARRHDTITHLPDNVTNATRFTYICSGGHERSKLVRHYLVGQGCLKCAGRCSEISEQTFYAAVSARLHMVLSSYVSSHVKVWLACFLGHAFAISPAKFKAGKGCPVCAGFDRDHAIALLLTALATEKYALLSPYTGRHDDHFFRCPVGDVYLATPAHFLHTGTRCPDCFARTTVAEYIFNPLGALNSRWRRSANSPISKDHLTLLIDPSVITIYAQSKCTKTTNVDHIIPLSWFNSADFVQVRNASLAANHQIISYAENKKKRNNLPAEDQVLILNSPELSTILRSASRVPKRHRELYAEMCAIADALYGPVGSDYAIGKLPPLPGEFLAY